MKRNESTKSTTPANGSATSGSLQHEGSHKPEPKPVTYSDFASI